MESDAIKELLLADGWEQVTGADLSEGDHVAWRDGSRNWRQGNVAPAACSEKLWWVEWHGYIDDPDVLLRSPRTFKHSDVRFDEDGHKHMNVSWEPRNPVYVKAELVTPDLLMKDGVGYCSLRSKQVDVDTLTKEKPA